MSTFSSPQFPEKGDRHAGPNDKTDVNPDSFSISRRHSRQIKKKKQQRISPARQPSPAQTILLSHENREKIFPLMGHEEMPPLLCGIKPVLELLEMQPERIDTLWLRRGRRSAETERILDLCHDNHIRFCLVDGQTLDHMLENRVQHQGVVARLFAAGFVDYVHLLATGTGTPLPLIVALDQVQDPGNAGTLARTLHAMGGAGLVIPRHNGVYLGAGARRSAAGALEQLPVAKVTNLGQALNKAHEAGWHIYGAAVVENTRERDEMRCTSLNALVAPLRFPAMLVLGNEEKGLRPQIREKCDHLLSIPMLRPFDSLNVAQAGAILVSCFARCLPIGANSF